MSTRDFDHLFTGYPNNRMTRGTRRLVHATIVDSLGLMGTAKHLIKSATQQNEEETLHLVIRMTRRVWVKLMGDGAPMMATEAVQGILNQASAARRAWSGIDDRRPRSLRSPSGQHKATPEQFAAAKAAYTEVVDNLIAWLNSARPDE